MTINGLVNFTNRKMRRKRKSQTRHDPILRTQKSSGNKGDEILFSPPVLSLIRNPEKTREFLQDIRKMADSSSSISAQHIDLVTLTEIDIDAALALVAELDRWQRIKGVHLRASTVDRWQPNILEKLESLGFFRLLKTDVTKLGIKKQKRCWLPFMTGTQILGPAVKKLRIALEKILPEGTKYKLPIYNPIIESMKNAIEHGYNEDIEANISSYPYFGKRWWMAGSYNETIKQIEVVFLDLGLTIPSTYNNSLYYTRLKSDPQFKEKVDLDSFCTRIAMRPQSSRLEEYQRGKGFNNILDPARTNYNKVVVNSRKAHCEMKGKNLLEIERNIPFDGTLIKWYINLPDVISERGIGDAS